MGSKQQAKKVALAGIVGVAVGLAIGILAAPKSGKETRQDIKDATGKFKDELFKRYGDVQTSLSETIEEAMGRISDFKGSAQESLESLIDQAKNAEYKAKDVYRAVRHGEADDKHLDKAIDQANKAKENLSKYLNK
jgi:gas vesicle protein